jgi:uncharacterized membrane protein
MPDPGQAAPGGGYAPPPPAVAVVQSAGMEENLASALCYAFGWITGVLFLVLAPYNQNKTIRFHAFQSIFWNVALIPLYIVIGILSFILGHIPVIGALAVILIYAVLGFGIFGLWLFLMYKAYNKEKFVLPIIGPLAEKQAGA